MFWLALGIVKSKPRNSLIQLQVEKVKKKIEQKLASSKHSHDEGKKHDDYVALSKPWGVSHPSAIQCLLLMWENPPSQLFGK